MTKLNPPFRADHVGSFLRPAALKAARDRMGLVGAMADRPTNKKDDDALKALEDEGIKEVVALQESVGLNVVTDGELRRSSWAYATAARIDGMVLKSQQELGVEFVFSSGSRPPVFYTEGKLKRAPGGLVADDYRFLRNLTDRTIKVTVPTPSLLFMRAGRKGVSETAYPDMEAFVADLLKLYQEEIAELSAEGCTYFQIDNTDTAILCDPKFQEMARARGEDPKAQIRRQAELVSRAVGGRPDSMTVSMHLCRGNSAGNWMAEGGYEYVAETLFNAFDVDAFFLEYDDERAGDFAPLRFVPKDKMVVLGLVTTKRPENDDKETLMRRIADAARYVPLDNLALSPQCGFASVAAGNPITVDDERRKLALIVETADEVWGSH